MREAYFVSENKPINDLVKQQIDLLEKAHDDFVNAAKEKNIITVAAAGNDNSSEPFYPAAFDNTISIASIDENLNIEFKTSILHLSIAIINVHSSVVRPCFCRNGLAPYFNKHSKEFCLSFIKAHPIRVIFHGLLI